jgi:hypothetical protein
MKKEGIFDWVKNYGDIENILHNYLKSIKISLYELYIIFWEIWKTEIKPNYI